MIDLAIPARRDRIVVVGCCSVLTAFAWAYLLHLNHQMSAMTAYNGAMADMGMRMNTTWHPADVWFTFAMWAVMMVGMMTPSAAPMMLLVSGASRGRGAQRRPHVVVAFGTGYLVVWITFSAVATLAQWALHHAAMLSPSVTMSSARLGGAILIVAGIYQLTPFKRACLTHCRSPLGFLLSHWRDGVTGALRMGMAHGTYCLGCCWALMCVLFVVGVMNLVWVAVLTIFVLVEKVGPAAAFVARGAGVAMMTAGAVLTIG